MTGDEKFAVDSANGSLAGWCAGSGLPVLLLHGGPGLSFSYMDELGAELADGFRVASFQQRGLRPSTVDGPFTMAQAIEDAVRVLDGLGWDRALLVGHSWGGHLALRVAAAHPHRLLGALAVDPVGVVGDGGLAASEIEIVARTARPSRSRAREIQEHALAGEGTDDETLESLVLLWPAYFADPENVPPMPPIDVSVDAYSELIDQVGVDTDQVAQELAKGDVPFGIVAGAASPIPWGQAARRTVDLSPRAFLDVVPDAGHFVWLEAPGRVIAALRRLAADAGISEARGAEANLRN